MFPEVPPVSVLGAELGLRPVESPRGPLSLVEPVEAWSLPFLIDALMGRWNGPDFLFEWRLYFDPANRRGPSQFAQHLTYARVVPVESSPLAPVALADLIATQDVSAALGYLADHPVLVLKTSGVIIVGYAVRGIGQAVQTGIRTGLLRVMGIGGEQAGDEPEDNADEALDDDEDQ